MLQDTRYATNNEGRSWLHSRALLTDQSEGTGPMAKTKRITQSRLRELVSYDPETGIFSRVLQQGSVRIGEPTGTPRIETGHVEIRLDYVKYYAHRLAYFWMVGRWPKAEIDHRDGDPTNNRWKNLRPSDRHGQMRNTRKHKDNRSGFKGVSLHAASGLFRARIWVGKEILLGYFRTADEAHSAYALGAQKYYGEFARWN